jgi:hypothetical protein
MGISGVMADQPHVGQAEVPANPPQPGLKFLEFTVYFMGGLLILMLIVLIAGIIWKASRRGEAVPEAPKLINLQLPPGTPAGPFTLDGDRLVLQAGGEIIIVDVKKGTILSRVKLSSP